ncbi:hypothetical protein GCM10010305_31610 [Streptomyces termitum]|uniref:Uncharacterized protein n=1 Tax=Streptomyces termitum TaxID=67368 RepID=A0A918T2H6_9ACTN|nr:hypothetical protein GCM10010305_31610 [Streptomyces termitum]
MDRSKRRASSYPEPGFSSRETRIACSSAMPPILLCNGLHSKAGGGETRLTARRPPGAPSGRTVRKAGANAPARGRRGRVRTA